jgi:predicted membrane-bound spermidine synthase
MGNSVTQLENLETTIYDCFIDLTNTVIQITTFNTSIMDESQCQILKRKCMNYIKGAKTAFDSRNGIDAIPDNYLYPLVADLYSLPLTIKENSTERFRDASVRIVKRLSAHLRKYVALRGSVNEEHNKKQHSNSQSRNFSQEIPFSQNADPVIEL